MVKLFTLILISTLSRPVFAETETQIMDLARTQFADGHFNEAVESYSKISASSDFWLDAIEERAWAKTRLGQFEEALGDLQSINSPVWISQVGPESAMLSTFVSLKICAYKDVVHKIAIFKRTMLPRALALQTLIDHPETAQLDSLKPEILDGSLSMTRLGSKAAMYPRYFYRDLELINYLRTAETAKALTRLKQLAKADLQEIELNLKKMKLIEIELIQTVMTQDLNLKKKSGNLKFASLSRDQITFPVNDDEVWVDEVGHYQVKAQVCPLNSRKKL